jgi:exodeoxyribonuclease VII small subunit
LTNQPKTSEPAADEAISFEHALGQLEEIVHELEEGTVGLADSLARYERGVKLLRQCYGLLERAERQIELLTGLDAHGQPITAPLDDARQSLEEKAQARSRRRSTDRGSTAQ